MEVVLENKALLQNVNKALTIILIFLCAFFVVSNLQTVSSLQSIGESDDAPVNLLVDSQAIKPLSEYKTIVNTRELFRPFVFQTQKTVQVQTIDDVTKDLMLVGVVSVGQKEAILKNRRTRNTYFVGEGGQLGELRIISIMDDRIDVSYKQERKELFLW
jgi:hypothetical protein